MDLKTKVEKYCIENKIFSQRDKILIGVSGGADSIALLNVFYHLRPKYNFTILVAHINYNLRGEESDGDELFVKKYCFERNIALVIKNVKLNANSDFENQAREIRFSFFNKLAESYGMNKIAVGHNKKDQAETMIFKLFRGSGYTGLRGILPIDGKIIHPLLKCSREEIVGYLIKKNLSWREDRTNKENNYTRNKIRNQLMPWIAENINSNFIEKLSIGAEIFAETDEILNDISNKKYKKILLKSNDDYIELSLSKLKLLKPTLRFYIFRKVFKELSGSEKDFYHQNFEEIESIIESDGSKMVMLPKKIIVLKEYDALKFFPEKSFKKVDLNNSKKISSLRHLFTFEDYRISMKIYKKLPKKRYLFEDKNIVYLDLDKTSFPLIIRHRQPGDRFIPLGMKHSKKLKDFFIDEKVSKFERDKVLLFCDNEKILWVAGYRLHNDVAITSKTNKILRIKIEKISHKTLRHAERINK